jgi:hypothetical protein
VSQDLTIEFGALCDPLSEQLARLELGVSDSDELGRIQLIANAVAVVTVHGLISHAQSDRARRKLFKRLEKIIRPITGNVT